MPVVKTRQNGLCAKLIRSWYKISCIRFQNPAACSLQQIEITPEHLVNYKLWNESRRKKKMDNKWCDTWLNHRRGSNWGFTKFQSYRLHYITFNLFKTKLIPWTPLNLKKNTCTTNNKRFLLTCKSHCFVKSYSYNSYIFIIGWWGVNVLAAKFNTKVSI